jgi:hypothetical protein
MSRLGLFSLLFFLASVPGGQAADLCRAVAVRDVKAIDSPDFVLKRGDYDEAITQYRVNKKTGVASFCSHGGSCYPTHVVENGVKEEALHLTNCRIGKRDDFDDPEEVLYGLEVIRSAVSQTELKIDDLDNRLLQLGLCNACASNVAYLYVNKPQSRCAQVTRAALSGDRKALQTLMDLPDYCQVQ